MRLLSIFVVEMLMIALPFQTGAQQAKLNLGFEQVDASTEGSIRFESNQVQTSIQIHSVRVLVLFRQTMKAGKLSFALT